MTGMHRMASFVYGSLKPRSRWSDSTVGLIAAMKLQQPRLRHSTTHLAPSQMRFFFACVSSIKFQSKAHAD
jgi:hypothetical protein